LGQIVEGSNHLITNALSFGFEILELFFKEFFFFEFLFVYLATPS
jgi:hypothetical protein